MGPRRHTSGPIELVLGRRLVQLREAKAESQAAVAARAGISQSNLARIENGDRSATIATLEKIARAFRITLAEILADVQEPPPAPAKAEKAWARVCGQLRNRDERFLRGVEHLIRALEKARS